jgi:sulfide:quinone oxidoreductase
MKVVQITEDYSVSPQIAVEDVAEIARLGFRTLMCNRPDAEDPGQPDFARIAAAAEAHGLVVSHVPVQSGGITPQDVDAFRAAMAELPRPVFAYCRSGTRSQNLWRLAE